MNQTRSELEVVKTGLLGFYSVGKRISDRIRCPGAPMGGVPGGAEVTGQWGLNLEPCHASQNGRVMGFTSPLHSVRGYSISKPPVTVFVICLILCASATLAMGFFIQYAETILNPEVKEKWLSLLNHLIATDFCVFEGNEDMDVEAITQFIDSGIVNSTEEVSITMSVSVHLVSQFKKLPSGTVAAYGIVPVRDWAFLEDTEHSLTSFKMAHVIPPDLTENSNKNSCLILTVPSSFLPFSTRSSVCIPSFVNKSITHVGTISVIKPNGTNPTCKNGAFLKFNYNGKSEQDFYLSELEKQNVYVRLVHVSYFIFAVAVALICFSFLRTKTYTSVVTLDKIPLTL